MNRRFVCMLAAAAAVTATAHAQPAQPASGLTPDDFAYGLELFPGAGTLVQTHMLPAKVYRGVTRADLSDVRVFNAAGSHVPSAIRLPLVRDQAPRQVALPLFPVDAPTQDGPAQLSMRLERRPDGTLVATANAAAPVPASSSEGTASPRAYILDGSQLQGRTAALRVRWDGAAPFVATLTLESSSDLATWHTVGSRGTVAQLEHQGHALQRNRVVVATLLPAYLRITSDRPLPMVITSTDMELVPDRSPPKRETLSVAGSSTAPGVFRFDVGGPIPVDQVRVAGVESGAMATVSLLSSTQPQGPYVLRHRGLVYSVSQGDVTLEHPAAPVSLTRDRHWELRVEDGSGGLGADAPMLEVGWVPEQLVFVARGPGTHVLAYGSTRAPQTRLNATQILSVLPASVVEALPPSTADLGAAVTLGGAEVLRPAPTQAWKKGVLWAVLIAGVLLLLGMSYRLVSQLNARPGADRDSQP